MRFLLSIAAVAVLLFIGLRLSSQLSREDEVRSFDVNDVERSRVIESKSGQSLTRVRTVTNANGSITTSLEVAEITILFPVEKKHPTELMTSTSDNGNFSYSSPSLNVSIEGEKLTVEGKNYGTFEAGDEVDLRNRGAVLVNGVERQAVTP